MPEQQSNQFALRRTHSSSRKSALIAVLSAALPAAFGATSASAGVYTWGGNSAEPGGTNIGGYWGHTATAIWSNNGSNPVVWNNDGSVDAIIGNSTEPAAVWAVSLGDSTAKAYTVNANSVQVAIPGLDAFTLAGQGGKGAKINVAGQFAITSVGGDGTIVRLKDFQLTGAGSLTIDVGPSGRVLHAPTSAADTFAYTGTTTLKSGTYEAGSVLVSGNSNSPFGASSNEASNLIFDGGSFAVTSSVAAAATNSTSRLFTLGTNGGSLSNTSTTGRLNFTNSGQIGLQGEGPRTLTLDGVSTATVNSITGNVLAAIIPDQNPLTGKTSVSKIGSGVWTLTGNSTYTGDTTVSAGKLIVNGAIVSSVLLSGTGSLGGSGTTGSVVAGDGTTISPGNSIGTIHTGSVAFGDGSIFDVEVGAAGSSDLLAITGSLDLSAPADTLALTNSSGFDGSDYTIATFTEGSLGSDVFNTVTLDGIAVNPAGFTIGDFTYVVAYSNSSSGGGSIQLTTLVPEPTFAAIASITAAVLLGQRRRILGA